VYIQGGQYHHLDDPDIEKIKTTIGVYYDYFPKINENNDVVFSVPYNDSAGLGKRTNLQLLILIN